MTLLRNGSQAHGIKNEHGLLPIQIFALKCNLSCIEVILKLADDTGNDGDSQFRDLSVNFFKS